MRQRSYPRSRVIRNPEYYYDCHPRFWLLGWGCYLTCYRAVLLLVREELLLAGCCCAFVLHFFCRAVRAVLVPLFLPKIAFPSFLFLFFTIIIMFVLFLFSSSLPGTIILLLHIVGCADLQIFVLRPCCLLQLVGKMHGNITLLDYYAVFADECVYLRSHSLCPQSSSLSLSALGGISTDTGCCAGCR